MRIVFAILIPLMLLGCKARKMVPKTIEREVKVVVRDTVFKIERDSSRTITLVDCIDGKPVLKKTRETPGKNLKAPKLTLKDSVLTVDCEARAQELLAQWKETHSTEKTEIPVYINELTFWQEVQINLGRALLALALIVTAVQLLKKWL
ncbi:hypothetical protein EI546_06540 [Aequorivita sp. H23M31]|uniref:Lipoprotein n=1 Tax=Aequorivita ciconiae TaxID=2494375 RepID=A0A410G284_9FLAO|nr:hypothetical protein [Aequorivita sp. H23M31]QAA81407.1 hypothetical protein EI546_06540 [Aequorivita sp. H23M31]